MAKVPLVFIIPTTKAAAIYAIQEISTVQEVRMNGVTKDTLSRRNLMAAALAAPAVGYSTLRMSSTKSTADPLVGKASEWVAANARIEAMSAEADELQGLVFDKARELGVNCGTACRSRLPEARRYRALNGKVITGYRDLAQMAAEIGAISAVSVDGALAKIELALNVQGPFDWRDHALELAEAGLSELRQLAGIRTEPLPQMSVVRESLENRD